MRLNLRTDASDSDLTAMIDEVEQRLARIDGAPRGTTPSHVFLLVALTLADDLRKARADGQGLRTDLTALLERAILDVEHPDPSNAHPV